MPSTRTIHAAFRAMARSQPDATALTDERTSMTYAALDELTDRLALVLRDAGVCGGHRVGVCLAQDANLVVMLLAILKAGAAYVPMDLYYPPERLRYIAEDAGLSFVIVAADDFPGSGELRALHPDMLRKLAAKAARHDEPYPGTAVDEPAYVIYTSGSTGRPKGVVVAHRNVSALLAATRTDLGLGPADVWTMFHSVAFDVSVWEIWVCLLTGGRLVVVPHWISRSPDEFYDLLVNQRVTVLSQTPSAFAQLPLVDRRVRADLALRLVVFAGEPLDARMLRDWFSRHPPIRCRMVNMYGITETTVHSTIYTVTPDDARDGTKSVGVALPGWTLSIRDDRGELAPSGVAGEIYVGGAGVASHYLGRPDLTAERFVADPRTGERIYRSGDQGRLRPDGGLDHLGRLDNQVKVRGYRVELDEIRSVLLDDPAVAAAAVVLGGGNEGDAALVRLDAYVVAHDGTPSPAGIRRRASRMLPDYMVPSTITVLASLPLTANGKLDKARLPPPALARTPAAPAPAVAESVVAESVVGETVVGETEPPAPSGVADTMLRVWREVLGADARAEDSFFELGGNSLLAVRLIAAMRAAGLPRLGPREIYLNPTASRLARHVANLASI